MILATPIDVPIGTFRKSRIKKIANTIKIVSIYFSSFFPLKNLTRNTI